MTRVPLSLPPGVFRNGTELQSAGRYYDAYCVRWYGEALGPTKGWSVRSADKVSGMARAALAWKTNDGTTYLAIGTHTNLYASNRLGDIFDITPSGFTAGRADATGTGGYGTGPYGVGPYGVPRPDNTLIADATQWTLDSWGEDLLGVSPDDGKLYQWALDTDTAATQVTNSPDCKAVVVTPERFVFALATDDARTVSWCDQEDNTDWTPSVTNQAGSFPLQTAGRLMCGKPAIGGTLVLTDLDVWLAEYVGGTLVYGFEKKGDDCGAISRQCMAHFEGGQVAWWSPSGFWLYNGYIQNLNCDVLDYVKSDMNALQVSKIVATVNSANFEIEWRYCSNSSSEIDRCVIWNYKDNIWNIGRPARTCGVDAGVFRYPIQVGTDGTIYDHESSFDYGGDVPFAEGGPLQIGNGDKVVHVTRLISDEKTSGDVSVTFKVRFEPNGDETTLGPYNLSAETNIRFVARMAKVRWQGVRLADWRVGTPSIEGTPGGGR